MATYLDLLREHVNVFPNFGSILLLQRQRSFALPQSWYLEFADIFLAAFQGVDECLCGVVERGGERRHGERTR